MKRAAMTVMVVGFVALIGASVRAEDAVVGKQGDNGKHIGRRGQRFEQMDADKDGKITYEEFKTFVESKLQERFKALDANGDGVLTKEDRPSHGEGKGPGGEGRGHGRRHGEGKHRDGGNTAPAADAGGQSV